MIKKVFKWILRIFLFLLVLAVFTGGYFYFFPLYSDYGISEDYFETRFHSEGFNSPKNGYEIWSSIPELFTGVQGDVDAYSRCYVESGDCNNSKLPEINENNKQQLLSNFLESDEYSIEYINLIEDVLESFEEMLRYDYISTLDYDDYQKLIVGEETKDVLTFTSLIQFSRSLGLYYDNSSNKNYIRVFGAFYKSLSVLSYKLDSGLIDYLVIVTILNTQFEYLENDIDRFNDGEKQFYSSDDTMNLLRKNHYNKINNICEENWPKKNGRNFLGRILIQGNSTCYSSQYIKQKDLLQKRDELIQLLSN